VTRTSEAEVIDRVTKAELLVLDDLGAERPTDWVEETRNHIVNSRYNDRRPTIFTTNYEDLEDDQDIQSLKARVGRRMLSRLREMCQFLEYDGPDFRGFEHRPSAKDLERSLKTPRAAAGRGLPDRTTTRARARLRSEGQLDLGWSGGKASS